MSAFRPGIGHSDFKSFREDGFGYVDKTFLISEVLADPALVLLFPRPRRFGKTIKLAISNQEVKLVYEEMFRNWFYTAAPTRAYIDDLVKALFADKADIVQKILGKILVTAMSYQDPAGKEPEKLYHGFILGLMVHLENEYDVRSNPESGYGRADMLMRPKKPGKPGVVMELKVRDEDEDIETVLKEAAQQVRDRQYAAELAAAGASLVYEYAMVFDGKKAWVRKVDALLGGLSS